ncbi:MAG TPA: DUF1565 domain-containing protein [Verrucomicrobiae bacterium]|nr:DUF1565 domain-containing protein [Verrucomicrobiae bacterium]
MPLLSRLFLGLVVTVAAVGLLAGGGCTKRGKMLPSPTPPSAQTIFVNPATGNDTTGNGSSPKPYKTLTRAIKALPSAEPFADTIALAPGDYNAKNGEVFPIAIPTGVTLAGSGYGSVHSGVFIDGAGEDTAYEKLAGVASQSLYTTLEVDTVASISMSDVYVGDSKLSLPAHASYVASDVLGTASAQTVTFDAGVATLASRANGILVPSGDLTCTNCTILGAAYGVAAQSLPSASAPPSVTLAGASGGETIVGGQGTGIATDGTADVTVSDSALRTAEFAYADTLGVLKGVSVTPGLVDFGSINTSCGSGSSNPSIGGNDLHGLNTKTEIFVTVAGAAVCAYNNTWNTIATGPQKTDAYGDYPEPKTFKPGASGKNVTIAKTATGSTVTVGPYRQPTPTPSASPTSSASPTASPTSSPT